MNEKDKVIDKIKKLFELSRSSNIAESESALKKAHELLIRYNLSRSEIDIDNYIDRKIGDYKRLKRYESELFSIVGEFFLVKALWRTGGPYFYVGEEVNCRIADYTFCYLLRTVRRLVSDFKKKYLPTNMRYRKNITTAIASYGAGLVLGIYRSLHESVKKEHESGLVYAGDPKLKAHVEEKFNPRIQKDKKTKHDKSSVLLGVLHGEKIKINAGIEAAATKRDLMLGV